MTVIAGFTAPGHPLAHDRPLVTLSPCVLAVSISATEDNRLQRYSTARHWCSAGRYLPVPWQMSIAAHALEALTADAIARLGAAVAEIGETVEIAFSIAAHALQDDGAIDPPARHSDGRAYLRSLQKSHPALLVRLRRRLATAAGDRLFDIPRARVELDGVEGLLSCSLVDAGTFSSVLTRLASVAPDSGIVEGPLPPFGTAMRVIASLGLDVGRAGR